MKHVMDAIADSKHSTPDVSHKRLEDEQNGELAAMDTEFTLEEQKGLTRKIDTFILPFMCFTFFLQYLDKQSLSMAAVFNLITDLNLSNEQFSWCNSLFYIGQLVSEYPFIYLMSRLPLTKFVGVTVIIWGAVCMCLAAPSSFTGFAAVRFLLGFAEGAVSPAFVTLTSIWYLKEEHATRTAFWVSMNGLAQTLGCLLMYGIGKNTSLSIAPWRTLFIICGAITVLAGVIFFAFMPTGPGDAWFLNRREKQILRLRMAKQREGGDKTSFSTVQLRETILDPKAWCVFWFGVLLTMQSPVLIFASLVIKSEGYTQLETMLYTSPTGLVQVTLLWFGVVLCWLFPRQRVFVVVALTVVPIAGNVLLLKLPVSAGWGLIVASWLASCITASMTVILSLIASNVKGNTKRAIVNTMFFIGYCAGCIGAPQLWTKKPRYKEGVITAIVTWVCLIITIMLYRVLCVRDNKRRDSDEVMVSEETNQEANIDSFGQPHIDMTDKQDHLFRYST